MGKGADNRQRTVAALAVLRDGAHASSLCDYMSAFDAGAVKRLVDIYSAEDGVEQKMERVVRQIAATEKFRSVSEIHPAWILEKLCDEPPRVIGIILRSLPAKHVAYILKNLPPMLRAQVPNMVESFAVAAPVLDVIRRRFERHFVPMPISRFIEHLNFENLYFLKGEEMEELIHELGVAELAMALLGIHGRTIHAVLNRLDLKDAKRLQARMRELEDVPRGLSRQARMCLLEMDEKHVGPHKMLMRMGLSALAHAMGDSGGDFIRLIQQRLLPADGYMLKRLIAERRLRPDPGAAARRQEMALDIVSSLAKEGRIDPSWGRFFPEDEVPSTGGGSDIGFETEDETATAQQLA